MTAVRLEGIRISELARALDSAGGNSQDMGNVLGFIVHLAQSPFAGVIATAAGAWLHARYGRKVRLKIGDIEVEAQTEKQLRKLLEHAREFQDGKSKVIRER